MLSIAERAGWFDGVVGRQGSVESDLSLRSDCMVRWSSPRGV